MKSRCRKGGGTYPSEKLARSACRRLRKRAIDWFALNAYFCRQHQGWHVGTRRLGVMFARWHRGRRASERAG